MTNWARHNLYDRIWDRWREKDGAYGKANANREIMTTYYRSDEVINTDDAGNLVGQSIYNGTGAWDARLMSTGFQGSLVSKNIPWIRYKMEELRLKGIDEIDAWLQKDKEHMTDAYQRSNFYDVQPNFTLDGVTTGSPVMFGVYKVKEKKTVWRPQHFNTVRVYYNVDNEPEGVITQDKTWTAKQIMDTFVGPDDENLTKSRAKLSQSVVSALDTGMLDEVFVVYRATFKVDDPIWDSPEFKKPTGDWAWLSAYFLELTTADANKKNTPLNDDMGDFTQPFAIWNYDKKSWEASSRTPAFYALWDNLSLQQIDKNYLEDIQYLNRPAMVMLNSMQGRARLGPEGMMYVSDAEYDKSPKPVDRVGGIKFSQDLMELKEEALKRWFMVDFFTKFSELVRTNKQPVSAAQIWQLAGEKATLLSPAIETHSVYLESIDARMVDNEIRAGRGPFAPDEMANITDIIQNALGRIVPKVSIQPVFIGQLAQAQKTSQAIEPIRATMEEVNVSIFPMYPEIRHKYNPYKITEKIEEALDFPQDAIVSEEEYDNIVAAERQALAQQAQAELAIEAAKAAPAVSGPVDESSILAGAV